MDDIAAIKLALSAIAERQKAQIGLEGDATLLLGDVAKVCLRLEESLARMEAALTRIMPPDPPGSAAG